MENLENENRETVSTPMGKLWNVIGVTMLGTILIGYAWHGMEMFKLRTQNEHEENAVRVNIVKLTAYRDQLKAGASSTIKIIAPK